MLFTIVFYSNYNMLYLSTWRTYSIVMFIREGLKIIKVNVWLLKGKNTFFPKIAKNLV